MLAMAFVFETDPVALPSGKFLTLYDIRTGIYTLPYIHIDVDTVPIQVIGDVGKLLGEFLAKCIGLISDGNYVVQYRTVQTTEFGRTLVRVPIASVFAASVDDTVIDDYFLEWRWAETVDVRQQVQLITQAKIAMELRAP